MDVLHTLGRASVAEVVEQLDDPPSYNSVRVTLSILERKGVVQHARDGKRYVFKPTQSLARARQNALQHVIRTYFRNSASELVHTLSSLRGVDLDPDELRELADEVERAQASRNGARRR